MDYDLLLVCSCSAAIILILYWVVKHKPDTRYKAEKWFWVGAIGLIGIAAIISTLVATTAINDAFAYSAFDADKFWLTWR